LLTRTTRSDALDNTGTMFDVPTRARFDQWDWIILAVLLLLGVATAVSAMRAVVAPKEDALMLLRYSEHLAQGFGITWNVGEKPVEGATDFLYMVMVAGVSKITGIDVIHSARLLIGVSFLALPLIVFSATRLTMGGNRWLCAAIAFYMAAGPGAKYIGSCFGAPIAALAAAVTWWLANELMYRRVSWAKSMGLGLSAVVLGLIRPEGSLLGIFILMAVLIKRPRQAAVIGAGFIALFAPIGIGYFMWRWHYFGYMLPNPFYVKGGGHLHVDGLKSSFGNVCRMVWPVIPIAALALRTRESRKNLLIAMVPVALFTGIWVLLSNENNHLMRFQFPLVPIVLISVPSLVWGVSSQLRLPRWADLPDAVRFAATASLACYLLISMFVFRQIYGVAADVASGIVYPTSMRKLADKGYTMAVTEAGQFPFYSKWKAIDVLGLNDAHIAHEGISEQYLDRYQPELMMYHLSSAVSYPNFEAELHEAGQPIGSTKEDKAIRVMHQYALHHDYILAAAYGDWACNMHFFWVKPGTADTDELVNYIRNTPYYFLDSGKLSADYRNNLAHFPCTMS
jgi:arabinofuranosyltransferase